MLPVMLAKWSKQRHILYHRWHPVIVSAQPVWVSTGLHATLYPPVVLVTRLLYWAHCFMMLPAGDVVFYKHKPPGERKVMLAQSNSLSPPPPHTVHWI